MYRCRVEETCPWLSEWDQKGRLVHEFQHYGWSERIARQSVQRLTDLANSVNGRTGWQDKRVDKNVDEFVDEVPSKLRRAVA